MASVATATRTAATGPTSRPAARTTTRGAGAPHTVVRHPASASATTTSRTATSPAARPRPTRRSSTAATLQLSVAIAVAAAYLVAAFHQVFTLRSGPVVASLTAEHGIHRGDLLALPMVGFAALVVVLAIGGCARAERVRG